MNALTRSAVAYWQSSIGKKLIVAVTGLAMVLFLAAHLTGNLLIYAGQEAFNEYAEFLHSAGHGTLVWFARIGLLGAVGLHIIATVALTRQNKIARNKKYEYSQRIQAKQSSLLMIWSGLTILAFVVFHILHFTVRINSDLSAIGETDPYGMVIAGFQFGWLNAIVVAFYILAMTCLCSHLSHGVGSIFQTLGWRSKKSQGLIRKISLVYSWVIYLGFISVPIAIFVGLVK